MLFRILLVVLTLAITVQASELETGSPVHPIRTTVGLALGTPAVLNPVVSHYFGEHYGVRVSGGYFPSRGKRYAAGFQANLLRKLRESRNTLFDASLFVGYLNINDDEVHSEFWRYVGVAGSVKWKVLYCELSLSIGGGSWPNPQGLFQFGVVFYTDRKGK